MLGVSTKVQTDKDAATAVQQGVQDALLDAMGAGFNRSQDIIAAEATDRGTLLQSGIPPKVLPDGSVISGYAAQHAPFVDKGTRPHWAPAAPLVAWARRVLGEEEAGYAVQRKIAEEGTEGVRFMERFVTTVQARLNARGISASIEEHL